MITIRLNNSYATIENLSNPERIRDLRRLLSYKISGHQFMNLNGWDGTYYLLSKSGKMPIGLVSMASKYLESKGENYQIVDERPAIKYGPEIKMKSGTKFKLRDYQQQAIQVAVNSGSGIIQAATGAGKTTIIASILAKYNCKTIVYVIGTDLLYQMKNTIEEAFGIKCGIVGDGHCDIRKVTVMTIWSAVTGAFDQKCELLDSDMNLDSAKKNSKLNKQAIRDAVNSAEILFFDECQYCAAETIQFLHKQSTSARHRFLLSGTPYREDGADILIEAVGGPKICQITASELIQKGWLVRPNIHFINVPPKKNIGKTYQDVYQKFIVDNEIRNELIVKATKKLVAAGRKVLLLVVRKEHGKCLKKLLESDLDVFSLDGSNKTETRITAIKDLESGKLNVLIASKIFDQGIDIPQLDALVLCGSGKSSARALQRIGRVIRSFEGKKNAIVVDFWDNCKYLKDHSKARYKIYLTEPEFKIKMPNINED